MQFLNNQVIKHGGLVGTFDKNVGKYFMEDISPKRRSLALRAIAGDRESDSAGVVCWVIASSHKDTKVYIIFSIAPTSLKRY